MWVCVSRKGAAWACPTLALRTASLVYSGAKEPGSPPQRETALGAAEREESLLLLVFTSHLLHIRVLLEGL